MKCSFAVNNDPIDSITRDAVGESIVASEDFWTLPVLPVRLSRNDVHLWRLELDQPHLDILGFASTLSTEERMRAASFRFERHRNRFIVAHGALRKILSFYLNISPHQLRFRNGVYGKPYLAKEFCRVQFSMAHSNELALYAFTIKHRIGVDLEYIHQIPDVEKMLARFLPRVEDFEMLPNNQKLSAFFTRWTRTEAYAKAVGTGLAQSFDGFDASLTLEEPACPSSWFITSFTPAPDYTASLVVEGHSCILHYFEFVPSAASMKEKIGRNNGLGHS